MIKVPTTDFEWRLEALLLDTKGKIISHLSYSMHDERDENFVHPEFTLTLARESRPLDANSIPVSLLPWLSISRGRSQITYQPVLYSNDFWRLKDGRKRRDEIETIKLTINTRPLWCLQILMHGDLILKRQEEMLKMGSGEGDQNNADAADAFSFDSDSIKRMFIDNSPFILLLTAIVACLHSLFDFLAFSSDIRHWRDNVRAGESGGISLQSLIINAICQFIILLYLSDQQASWIILLSQVATVALELWKVGKGLGAHIRWNSWLPSLHLTPASTQKQSQQIREWDQQATRWLMIATTPILLAYAIWNLNSANTGGALQAWSGKKWYSWSLSTLVGFVYAFGFILMTPQLFINYRLKSVAHLPWRTFTYKALNTFIDDLFAFIIRMPTMHRLACLRDDIIFVIFLWQWWIYPVDKSRANEFGQVAEEEVDEKEEEH